MNQKQQKRSFINLEGQWAYALDPLDKGEVEMWYGANLSEQQNTLQLPGTLSGNQIGQSENWGEEMTREAVRSLRQRHRYVGAAWYQYELDLPLDWMGKRLIIYLERVMFKSTLWINDKWAGDQDSLSTPHQFDVTDLVRIGVTNCITIRVDNRDIHNLGEFPSAYTDETQTIWNGMIGRLEIQALDPVHAHSIQLYSDIEYRRVTVKGTWTNTTKVEAQASLALTARVTNGEYPHQTDPRQYAFVIAPLSSEAFSFDYDMGEDILLWDEFSPNMYEMKLASQVRLNGTMLDWEQFHPFGMRSFQSNGSQFNINGRKTFLRGTLECCIFPLTGHPPMGIDPWMHLFETAKAYGLNHIRFHSWCPPEAAFEAADQIGIYVQAEGPVWMDTWNSPVGAHPEHYSYLPEEAGRIIAAYGNHPSFCLFSNGNELNGDFDLLHKIIADLKDTDNRRVYTLTTNWDRPLDPADDLFCSQTVDGTGARGQYFPDELTGSTTLDYQTAVFKRNVPLVTHEVGQYTVYPDVNEIPSYTGVLRPVNLEVIKVDLERRGMLGDIGKFVRGSGMLALQLYRDEIEAALRTPNLGGFQLLDLHDFPGQSTATVGILNAFWESKGLIEPDQFRQFCSPTVLLLRMSKRIYTTSDTFRATVDIAHFGSAELPKSQIKWSITEDDLGRVLDQGILHTDIIHLGSGLSIGEFVTKSIQHLKQSTRLNISLEISGSDVRNEWPIWVYADEEEGRNGDSEIYIAQSMDDTVERKLAAGGRVLLLAGNNFRHSVPGKFYPVFWSPVHFVSENPCGIYIKKDHPVFGSFPTEDYAEYQWKDLLDRSVSIYLDDISSEIEPIVQVIPNFYHNRRMSNLFECFVGSGRLIVCSIDIQNDLLTRPAANQLRKSITTYMQSEEFQPSAAISMEQLRALLEAKEDVIANTGISGKEIAIGKEAVSDSVKNGEHAAFKGNDGIGHTMWLAADEAAGHRWQVDLGGEKNITGTKVKFHQAGNFLYVIQVSTNGEDWRVAVNQTGQTSEEQTRVDNFNEKARFVRIVYNGLPIGARAGHYAFEVYGY
ncbi:MAG: discoidin domain-containing protein [Paenibacillus sp.]|nr:discoidin domain-containing protein [Paenibacillus sp.]